MDSSERLRRSVEDFRRGLLAYDLWGYLGWHDIRQRYRRSLLGPLWLTLSTAVFVAAIGFLYAKFFGQPLARFLPFVAIGFIVWVMIQTSLNEACTAFIEAESVIKQIRMPFTAHLGRLVFRNVLVFLHNFAIVPVVMLAAGLAPQPALAVLPLSLGLLALNCFWVALVLATVCTRFRDIPPIVTSLLQLVFFLSPVIWQPGILGNRGWVADFNPVHHFMELFRAPVLEGRVPLVSFAVALGLAVAGSAMAFAVFSRFRGRLAYWL